jgi:hypothetical protein
MSYPIHRATRSKDILSAIWARKEAQVEPTFMTCEKQIFLNDSRNPKYLALSQLVSWFFDWLTFVVAGTIHRIRKKAGLSGIYVHA